MSIETLSLKRVNNFFKQGDFIKAIIGYIDLMIDFPELESVLIFNLQYAQTQYKKTDSFCDEMLIVDLLSVNNDLFSHKAFFEKNHILFCNSCFLCFEGFSGNKPSFIDNKNLYLIKNQSINKLLPEIIDFIRNHPKSSVFVSELSFFGLIIALVYKLVWGSSIFMISKELHVVKLSQENDSILWIKDVLNKYISESETGLLSNNIVYPKQCFAMFDKIFDISDGLFSNFGSKNIIWLKDKKLEKCELNDIINTTNSASFNKNKSFLFSLLKLYRAYQNGNQLKYTNDEIIDYDVSKIGKDTYLIINSEFFDFRWYIKTYQLDCHSELESAKHFMSIGWKLGYDPSSRFCTTYYLNRYKTVAEKKFNPLLHYIKYGKNQNYVPKNKICFMPENDIRNKTDIYICCWLKSKDPINEELLDLYLHIKSFGLKSQFVTHSEDIVYHSSSPNVVNVAAEILDVALYDLKPEYNLSNTDQNDIISAITKTPYAKNKTLEEIVSSVRKAYSYWRDEFLKNQTKLVLIWGSTSPMSRLFINLCAELKIEYIIIERGHFFGTLYMDLIGQFAFGGSNILATENHLDEKKYQHQKLWIQNIQGIPYAHKNNIVKFNNKIFEAKANKQKICLFIGVNDVGSGIAYTKNSLESHSIGYFSSFELLNDLVKALPILSQNLLIIVKSHPADKSNYISLQSDKVIIENNSNINELIKIADFCVTMSTTTIARCIVEEKPVVTASLTDVSGLDIAYECKDRSEIINVLRSAMRMDRFSTKNHNGKIFIQKLLKNNIFSNNSNGCTRSIRDLAEVLSQRVFFKSKISNLVNQYIAKCAYDVFELDGLLSIPDKKRLPVDIIIPVYGSIDITFLAIQKALLSLDDNDRVIVVNDASPDPNISIMLKKLEKSSSNLVLLDNDINLGFSGSVNRAIAYSRDRDVVLLNSDAIVPIDFLSKMKNAAYSHYRIATVTPFSNNASIYSLPFRKGEELTINDVERKVKNMNENLTLLNSNKNVVVEIPSGHGFCMYLRRNVLDVLGGFDELLFSRGYSEEVDYCLRARMQGFMNVLLPSLYVGHIGGVSFDEDSTPLKLKNRKIIQEKYPFYFQEIHHFLNENPLEMFFKVE